MAIHCTHCSAENSEADLVNGQIQCRNCNEWFEVSLPRDLADLLTDRVKKIRSVAGILTNISILFSVIAGFIFIIAALTSVSEMQPDVGTFKTAGSFLASSLMFYLIAQVVYIRANTEK